MIAISEIDKKLIQTLLKNPTKTHAFIGKEIGVSTQTVARRIQKLQERRILFKLIARPDYLNLHLKRCFVIFNLSEYEQFYKTEMAVRFHNYLRGWNRFYGNEFGVLAEFQIPLNGINLFKRYLNFFREQKFFKNYEIFSCTGVEIRNEAPFPNEWIRNYRFEEAMENIPKQNTSLPDIEITTKLEDLSLMHLFILRDFTWNLNTSQTELIEKYKHQWKNTKKKNVKLYEYLNRYFSLRTENALKMDMSRKCSFVKSNLLVNERWNFNRSLFELNNIVRYTIIKGSKNEISKLFNFFKKYEPPFDANLMIFENGIGLQTSMNQKYDAIFTEILWKYYPKMRTYLQDYFDYHGLYFPFYLENFDLDKHTWKVDEKWLLSEPIRNVELAIRQGFTIEELANDDTIIHKKKAS
ncbi:MAG: AsnC family transcriptional regulator [Asgard group archaeon]|nr:AsnC family transcriptional regulator [Asgard group archaeon]